jgi:hypothetical protein
MRFYAIGGTGETWYEDTLADARKAIRDLVQKSKVGGDGRRHDWRDLYIDEVDVPINKRNIARLLNYEGGTHTFLRQWGATQRGGMKLQDREES